MDDDFIFVFKPTVGDESNADPAFDLHQPIVLRQSIELLLGNAGSETAVTGSHQDYPAPGLDSESPQHSTVPGLMADSHYSAMGHDSFTASAHPSRGNGTDTQMTDAGNDTTWRNSPTPATSLGRRLQSTAQDPATARPMPNFPTNPEAFTQNHGSATTGQTISAFATATQPSSTNQAVAMVDCPVSGTVLNAPVANMGQIPMTTGQPMARGSTDRIYPRFPNSHEIAVDISSTRPLTASRPSIIKSNAEMANSPTSGARNDQQHTIMGRSQEIASPAPGDQTYPPFRRNHMTTGHSSGTIHHPVLVTSLMGFQAPANEGRAPIQLEQTTQGGYQMVSGNHLAQINIPAMGNMVHLDAIFLGRRFNRSAALGDDLNSFEQELCCPDSLLNTEFRRSFLNYAEPRFTPKQLVTLALLGHAKRSASAQEILDWIIKHFFFYRNLIVNSYINNGFNTRIIPGFTLKQDVEALIFDWEMDYEVDFPPMGYFLEDEAQNPVAQNEFIKARWHPRSTIFKYFLPYGFENAVFAPLFSRNDLFGQWTSVTKCGAENNGLQFKDLIPYPESLNEKKERILALCLKKYIPPPLHQLEGHNSVKQKIFNYVLAFKEPLVLRYKQDGAISVHVEVPKALVAPFDLWSLPSPQQLLSVFLVSKECKYYASCAFFGHNHFKAVTGGRNRHILEHWLRRIGPSNLANLASVEFDVVCGRPHHSQRELEDSFKLLGQSLFLTRLVLHIETDGLPNRARDKVELVPGFKSLVKFKGVREIQVFGNEGARMYLQAILTPWVGDSGGEALRKKDEAWSYQGQRLIQLARRANK